MICNSNYELLIGASLFAAVSLLPHAALASESSLWQQPTIFDTPGGMKQSLRDAGINLDVWMTSFGQGVLSGDGDKDWQWGNKGDLIATFDGGKLGMWQGLYMSVHQEVVWGDDANNQGDGSILPLNTAMAFPRTGGDDHETSVTVTQAFGPRASITVGKINMLDPASKVPIMGGGGWETFMNTGLAAPISGVTPPYLLGAIGTLKTDPAIFTLMVYDPRNAQDRDVVEHPLAEGVTTSLSVIIPTKVFGNTGFYGVRGVYSSKEGLDLADVPELALPPESQSIQTKEGYWYASVSAQQYLWQTEANPAVGWGVFGQLSFSDGNPNPLAWSAIAGVGGTGGFFEGRDRDKWGIAYFHYGLSDDLKDGLEALNIELGDERGVEAYYNVAVAPWWRVTADVQWIDSATARRENALVASIRNQIKF
jgi:porin